MSATQQPATLVPSATADPSLVPAQLYPAVQQHPQQQHWHSHGPITPLGRAMSLPDPYMSSLHGYGGDSSSAAPNFYMHPQQPIHTAGVPVYGSAPPQHFQQQQQQQQYQGFVAPHTPAAATIAPPHLLSPYGSAPISPARQFTATTPQAKKTLTSAVAMEGGTRGDSQATLVDGMPGITNAIVPGKDGWVGKVAKAVSSTTSSILDKVWTGSPKKTYPETAPYYQQGGNAQLTGISYGSPATPGVPAQYPAAQQPNMLQNHQQHHQQQPYTHPAVPATNAAAPGFFPNAMGTYNGYSKVHPGLRHHYPTQSQVQQASWTAGSSAPVPQYVVATPYVHAAPEKFGGGVQREYTGPHPQQVPQYAMPVPSRSPVASSPSLNAEV
ncbi:hypothetical protein BC828DRAFT_409167 [Blastocladiella britannica]|nr:hypothetical protein BC828DRAFT_409167 [Blastocladiella britannica]